MIFTELLSSPHRTEAPRLDTRTLFCRSASVLGRPRRTPAPTLCLTGVICDTSTEQQCLNSSLMSTDADRFKSYRSMEERPGTSESQRRADLNVKLIPVWIYRSRWFCSARAAEDGRAPTEELACIRSRCFCSTRAAEDGRAPTEELACRRSRP